MDYQNQNENVINVERVDPAYRVFATLPRLTEDVLEHSSVDVTRIALIPVFSEYMMNANNLFAFLQSAIYSRASCLKNTDAVEQGVKVKLYVEDSIGNRLIPQMMLNGIHPNKDVLYFDSTIFGQSWNREGKKAFPYFDPQLASYEQVIFWDSNIFFPPLPKTKTLFRFFSNLPRVMHYTNVIDLPSNWRDRVQRGTRYLNLTVDEVLEELKIEMPTYPFRYPSTTLSVLPIRHLHENQADMLNWIRWSAPILGFHDFLIAYASFKARSRIVSLAKTHQYVMLPLLAHLHAPRTNTAYIQAVIPYGEDEKVSDYLKSL